MFADFDYSQFPNVKVKLNNIIDDDDFDEFLKEWLKLYIKKEKYLFIFDTTNVSNVPLKYSIRMAEFIKELKKNKIQYLEKSIILINNSFVKQMLNIILRLQSPAAPIYLISNETEIDLILNNGDISNIQCIMP